MCETGGEQGHFSVPSVALSGVLLDKQVEDGVRVNRSENALSKCLGRINALKSPRICTADGFKYLRSDGGHLVLCGDSGEGRKCGEVRRFILLRESVDRDGQLSNPLV